MNNTKQMAKLAINKSLLKEFERNSVRTVYMNNDDEFQIQLFNHYNYVIGVCININGKLLSDAKIVLRPGERIWLDRHIDNDARLKFSTYEVENSEDVKEAIRDNGKVDVMFYKEVEQSQGFSIKKERHWWDNPITAAPTNPWNPWDNVIYFGGEISGKPITKMLMSDTITCCKTELSVATAATGMMETGRIEKGSKSSQKFSDVDTSFQILPFSTETIQILPMSQKKIGASDLTKIYCHQCGRKLKQNYRYCPFCGSRL